MSFSPSSRSPIFMQPNLTILSFSSFSFFFSSPSSFPLALVLKSFCIATGPYFHSPAVLILLLFLLLCFCNHTPHSYSFTVPFSFLSFSYLSASQLLYHTYSHSPSFFPPFSCLISFCIPTGAYSHSLAVLILQLFLFISFCNHPPHSYSFTVPFSFLSFSYLSELNFTFFLFYPQI